MKVLFSNCKMLIDFLNDEKFKTRTLLIGGERLSNGFVASLASMRWDYPYETETIDRTTKNELVSKIMDYKFETNFKLIFEDEV